MEKIKLNQNDEYLIPLPGHEEEEDMGLFDDLLSSVGLHEFCNDWISIHQISKTHNVLSCGNCNLRILIPIAVDTWKKLVIHMKCNMV